MDIFTRHKFSLGVMGILVILNLLSLSMIWVKQCARPPLPPLPRHTGTDNVQLFLEKELRLSKDQAAEVADIRTQHQDHINQLLFDIRELKDQATSEMFAPTPDKNKIDNLIARIGAKQTGVEKLHFELYLKLIDICDADQKMKLQSLFKEILHMKPSPGEDRPPRRAHPEFRPPPHPPGNPP
jgi:Spy/CpxP family protein refolding chaperone